MRVTTPAGSDSFAASWISPKTTRIGELKGQGALGAAALSASGRSPFFPSVAMPGGLLGTSNLHHANAILAGLVGDGMLIEVEKGTRKR